VTADPEASGLTLASYGVRIGVWANDAEALERLAAYLPPGHRDAPARDVDRRYSLTRERGLDVLRVDGRCLGEGHDLDHLGEVFAADLQLYVAEMAPHHVFVHAGAVSWRGEAIIIPGRSLSGKTTLVAELVRAGATYYSDEYAVLDELGRVHPYTDALSIRPESPGRPRRCPVETLGGRSGTEPLPVALVVVTEYRRGAVWEPRLLSAGCGALALLANTVSVRRRPEAALAALREVVVHGTVLEGVRGEAGATVPSVLQAL
jgi:hypothetical protein